MKLYKGTRADIANKAVDFYIPRTHSADTFNKLADELCTRAIRNDMIDPVLLKFWDEHHGLKEAFKTNSDVRIGLRNKDVNGYFNWWENGRHVILSQPLPGNHSYFDFSMEDYPDICFRFKEESVLDEQNKDKRNALRDRLMDMLNACNTSKQLLEIMPELGQFLPIEGNPVPVPVSVYENLKRDLQILTQQKE